MSVPVPNSAFKAARRWVELLRVSSFDSAWTLLRSESRYADLSRTQYGAGFDLLLSSGLVSKDTRSLGNLAAISANELCSLLYRSVIEADPPTWLPDSDILINDPGELPNDAVGAALALGLDEAVLLGSIRSAHGKVDISAREEVGLIGEQLLVRLLEAEWPGSTTHISLVDDGAGYDVMFNASDCELHIEVKTTTRRGRLTIFLSRNEHEVALRDPKWRLVLVGLTEDRSVGAIASINYMKLAAIAPVDQVLAAQWQSVRYEISGHQTQPGVPDLPPIEMESSAHSVSPLAAGIVPGVNFGWLST